jgi:hypothetical protein
VPEQVDRGQSVNARRCVRHRTTTTQRERWPEMKPFGYSIPGEPLIPVDAYRELVRTEAAAMGIPLRDPSLPRNGTLAYRFVEGNGWGRPGMAPAH